MPRKKTEIAEEKRSIEKFEKSYAELKLCLEIVRQKESPLHKKIEALEKGVLLYNKIKEILNSAELKIEEIRLGLEKEEEQ